MAALQTLPIKLRLKGRHTAELNRQAGAVHFVGNYCDERQKNAARVGRRWLSYPDLARLTAGAAKELGLHSHTIQRIWRLYDASRRAKM